LLKKNLENYLEGVSGQYGIYYINLTTGEEFGINQEDTYTAASTFKIPLNLYLYKRIKSGSVDPQYLLTYEERDYEEGTGEIRYGNFGKKYSIRELSRLSIEESDNVAANMLLRYLGRENVKDFMRLCGGKVIDNDENVSSPKDMGLYMKQVYDFYKNDDVFGKELMDYFLNTEFSDRIPALLPKEVKVAHKVGNQIGTINDVGVIFADTPYVLSILSKDANEDEAYDAIAEISKKVYEYVNNTNTGD